MPDVPLIGLGVLPQAEEYLRPFGERVGGKFFIGVFSEVFLEKGIDGLTVLTRVDLNALVLAFEELDGGQSLGLEGVES